MGPSVFYRHIKDSQKFFTDFQKLAIYFVVFFSVFEHFFSIRFISKWKESPNSGFLGFLEVGGGVSGVLHDCFGFI